MRHFRFNFYCFSIFLLRFFIDGFRNQVIAHSRSSFLLIDLVFYLIVLELVFSIHSESVIGLLFCIVNENSLNCTSGLNLLFLNSLFLLITFFVLNKSKFSRLTTDLPHSVLTYWILNFSLIELRNVVNTVKVKAKFKDQKKQDKHINPGY